MKRLLLDSNYERIATFPEGWSLPRVGETVIFEYDFEDGSENDIIEATVTEVRHYLYSNELIVVVDYPAAKQP